MSADGVCIAITHTGTRCTSFSTDAAGHCAHHARIARVMALAPKPSASSTTATATASPVSAATTTASNSPYDLSSLKSSVSSNGASPYPSQAPVASYSLFPQSTPSPQPPQPASSYSILQSPLIAAAVYGTSSASSSPSSSASSAPTAHQNGWMLVGESLLAAINASFVFPQPLGLPSLPGSLFLTNFRLRFEPLNAALRSTGHLHRLLDDAIDGIPRGCVAKLSYPQAATAPSSRVTSNAAAMPTQLKIKFKDLRSWTLAGDVNTLMTTLNRHVFVDSPLSLFAFAASGLNKNNHNHHELQGHQIYDIYRDFQRMGVQFNGSSSSGYRVSAANQKYAICATYPQKIVVPFTTSDLEIAQVAEFRSKGRLPICCFVHSHNQSSIWRCAQPKRGIFNTQNAFDDQYLAKIAFSNPNQPKIWIADCRPELNARVNNLTGGGTESSSGGRHHASVTFLNIANIHAMRESMENVRALVNCTNPELDFTWLSKVEDTKWLYHVRLVLSAALRVADAVENKQTTVLVHCSDGWDRTGQLCGLSQLLLDAHYRTITGFMEIIEKEWILPGHKFHDRVGPGKPENDEQAPIFVQFLDCVFQMWRQFPTFFEFNSLLLEEIANAVYSGKFGTFLGNCDRERTTWGTSTRTPSLWAFVLAEKPKFTNPFYRPQSDRVLLPPASTVLRNVVLWSEYYFRGAVFDGVPSGNPCPPLWGTSAQRSSSGGSGSSSNTAKNTHQDLADALAAAVHRVDVLEQEAALMLCQQQQNGGVGRGGGAGGGGATMVVVEAQPPTASLAALPPPPPLQTVAPPPPLQPTPTYVVMPPPPPPVAPSLPPGAWVCAICSKTNVLQARKCIVCGRSPPEAALTTQL